MLSPPSPPYALDPPAFRFPALAALAGRLPLGSGREVVLSAMLAARVAAGAARPALPTAARVARSGAAVQWLNASCPDPRIRAACKALAEAAAEDDPKVTAQAIAKVIEVAAPHLDSAARSELSTLLRSFAA